MRQSVRQGQGVALSAILFNPVYGYGRWLEPVDVVIDRVRKRNAELAERERATCRSLTLDELDEEFLALLDALERSGLCRRMQDLPALVPKATWLRVQQEAIRRLATGQGG